MRETHATPPTEADAAAPQIPAPRRRLRLPSLAPLTRPLGQWARQPWSAGRIGFWVLFAALLTAAAVLRTRALDMPPFDFPADRQRSNIILIQMLRGGASLLSLRSAWFELWILPWLTAHSSWLCTLFSCEIWTLARVWSGLFGLLAVVMAAAAGYWAAAAPNAPPARRGRIALLWMAALAFNPYHLALSRMISTESVTLGLQASALALFWFTWRNPGHRRAFLLFIGLFILSGWAKIPSLIWLPGYLAYVALRPTVRPRTRLLVLAGFGLATLAIFWVYRVNPFSMLESYSTHYSFFASQAEAWIGSPLWIRPYLTRIVLMLTLPGALFALLGLLSAPWLFRLTALVFCGLFYYLVNLNLYNFCHIILPGTALAAWGVNSLIEAATAGVTRPWARRAQQGLALTLAGLLIWQLYPLGPRGINDPTPRGDALQAREVVRRLVPKGTTVPNDDGEGSIGLLIDPENSFTATQVLDLSSGYFYTIERLSDKAVQYAAAAWVRWASLPGEANGLLLTARPFATPPTTAALGRFQTLPVGATRPGLGIERCLVPRERYDPARQALVVHPGQSFQLGIDWKNEAQAPLAGITMTSVRWRRDGPVPLREGGFSIRTGGVLCLPQGRQGVAVYTIELPAGFPVGDYHFSVWPLGGGRWTPATGPTLALPFTLRCEPDAPPPARTERLYRQLYPASHTHTPIIWSDDWFYRAMRLEGYNTYGPLEDYFSCPLSLPGLYRITVRGEATPVTRPDAPRGLWPTVEVLLPGTPDRHLATLTMDSDQTGRFTASFTAAEPFDALLLRASGVGSEGREMPLWLAGFAPASYGRQIITLRGAALRLERPLAPATPTTPPGASKP